MTSVNNAIHELFIESPNLQFGMKEGLFNLTQLSDFIRPLLQARLERKISKSAVHMALSRYLRSNPILAKIKPIAFKADSLSVFSALSILTLDHTVENRKAISKIFTRLKQLEGHCSIAQGTREITIAFERQYKELVYQQLVSRPKIYIENVAALTVVFSKEYLNAPGFFYQTLQQVTLQGVNIIEISSTSTELIMYLSEKDVRLAFDTLYYKFIEKGRVYSI